MDGDHGEVMLIFSDSENEDAEEDGIDTHAYAQQSFQAHQAPYFRANQTVNDDEGSNITEYQDTDQHAEKMDMSDDVTLFDQFDDDDLPIVLKTNEADTTCNMIVERVDNDSDPSDINDENDAGSFQFFPEDHDNDILPFFTNQNAVHHDEEDADEAFISNDELWAAIEHIDGYQIELVEGMSPEERRSSIIYKLQCVATSLALQLISSTTAEEKGDEELEEDEQQQDSQASQTVIRSQATTERPPYHPLTLKLLKRSRSHTNATDATSNADSQNTTPAQSQAPPASQSQSQGSKFHEISFPSTKGGSAKQMAMTLRIMEVAKDALSKNQTVTLRDIYYRDKKLFDVQSNVDKTVDDLAATIGIRRADLNIQAASKGLVFGHLSFECETGDIIDCSVNPSGCLIPPADSVNSLQVVNDLKFVLVIEKEAIFRSLSTSAFHSDPVLGSSIIITGKGYPDVVTRELVHNLSETLPEEIPTLCLVDADPHGIDIFSVYRNGSSQMAFDDANLTAPRLRWMGVTAEDMETFGVDRHYLLPLTESDVKKSNKMLERDNLDDEQRQELLHMLDTQAKAEIQLLTSQNSDGLIGYLRAKVPMYLS